MTRISNFCAALLAVASACRTTINAISPKAIVLAVYCLILSGVIAVGTNSAHACHSDGNCAERYQAVHGINWISATADEVRQWHKDGGELNATGAGVNFPLYAAVSQGNTAAVKTLLELGADVNAKGYNGLTPLHAAATNGKAEVIPVLVKAGADVNAKSDSDWTPLHIAATKNKISVIRALITAGADVNATNGNCGTPWDYSKGKGEALIEKAGGKRGNEVECI